MTLVVALLLILVIALQPTASFRGACVGNTGGCRDVSNRLSATTTNPKDLGRGGSNDLFASSSLSAIASSNNKLPDFSLPTLTRDDIQQLQAGERVEKQNRDGRSGNGLVVVDVKASVDEIFDALASFDEYEEMIPTVRGARIYSSTQDTTVAEFSLSRFRLKINIINFVYRERRVIAFSLDPSRPNLVLRQADGFWYVEKIADRPGYSRVWLSASVIASRLIPTVIVDYAAMRALPRASSWLQPYFANVPYSRDDEC